MLKHIVMWRFKENAEGKTKQENMEFVAEQLLALRPIISEIKSMEIGYDVLHSDASYDMTLIVEFESIEEMKAYTVHPEHQAVSQYVSKVRVERAVVDFHTN